MYRTREEKELLEWGRPKAWNGLLFQNDHEFKMQDTLHTVKECVIEDKARARIQNVNPMLYRRLYCDVRGAA